MCRRGHNAGYLPDGHCKECRRQYERADPARALRRQKRWRERNPEKERARQLRCDLKRAYGLTVDQYNRMLAEQGGVCALCRAPETTPRKGTVMRLAVDHDHVTGIIRGLLCNRCNRVIGMFKDSTDLAGAAVIYLEYWRGLRVAG